jgi:hypothetical protein
MYLHVYTGYLQTIHPNEYRSKSNLGHKPHWTLHHQKVATCGTHVLIRRRRYPFSTGTLSTVPHKITPGFLAVQSNSEPSRLNAVEPESDYDRNLRNQKRKPLVDNALRSGIRLNRASQLLQTISDKTTQPQTELSQSSKSLLPYAGFKSNLDTGLTQTVNNLSVSYLRNAIIYSY